MRHRCVDVGEKSVLLAVIAGSAQERDLSLPANCEGLGRIRHFRADATPPFPPNPLPVLPAARWLGTTPDQVARAQVFQIAGCAWRCWYCYVPFPMLSGAPARGRWTDALEMVRLYAAEPDRPKILDLSGGSPDVAPEWIGWTMDAIEEHGLGTTTYLWSDDNLSSDILLRPEMRPLLARIARNRGYGRACCLKGYDAASFAYNTGGPPEGFRRQLEVLGGYVRSGMDLYGYVTLTGPPGPPPADAIQRLLDALAALDPTLPGRIVPLRIVGFGAMRHRVDAGKLEAMQRQEVAAVAWTQALVQRGVQAFWDEPLP